MPATLRVTRHAIGVEVRRGPFDVIVDGEPVGTMELHAPPFEMAIEPGHHTLCIQNDRNQSGLHGFDATEGGTVSFRCSGKSVLPIFLLSFLIPSLAISLTRS